jgi:hypothetical protein
MRATEPKDELTPAAEARRYVENARTLINRKSVSQDGLLLANEIINRCELLYKEKTVCFEKP